MKNGIRTLQIIGIAALFGILFWIIDGAMLYYYFRPYLRFMIFDPPENLSDAIFDNVPPYALRVRALFLAACLFGGVLAAILLNRQRVTEAALWESEEQYRLLFEVSPEMIIVLDLEGVIRDCNRAVIEFSGLTYEELVGSRILDWHVVTDEDVPRYQRLSARMLTGETLDPVEFFARLPDGRRYWLEVFPTLLHKGEEPYAVQLIVRNTDERKRALDALERSEATLKSIVRAAPVGIGLVKDRVLDWSNNTLQAMIGYSSEELSGQSSRILYPSQAEFGRVGQEKYAQIQAHGVGTVETQFQHKNGTVIDIVLSSAPIDPADLSLGVIFTALDITERVKAEMEIQTLNLELEQRVVERTAELVAVNKELEAFAYSVSHDLRAPLRSIVGFGHILQDDHGAQLDAEGQHYLRRIREASQRMSLLIDDLLQLSRVTRGEMIRRNVNLSALAHAVAAELQAGQPERPVSWVIAEDLTVRGDARLMRIVLENLLGNAWKFTQKQPHARIEFDRQLVKSGTAFFVRDNGPGFDMAYADKLFVPFQRLHSEAEYEGTGVGLATVQRIIHRQGGQIWAESENEKGATFYFSLNPS